MQAYASSRELERTTDRPMPLRLAASVNCATSVASASCGPSVEMVSVRVRSCSETCSHSRGAPLLPPPPLISTASPTCRRGGGVEAGCAACICEAARTWSSETSANMLGSATQSSRVRLPAGMSHTNGTRECGCSVRRSRGGAPFWCSSSGSSVRFSRR
eukprot:scaffold133349_cov90-Phaeocystis_antarctica.AAC.3